MLQSSTVNDSRKLISETNWLSFNTLNVVEILKIEICETLKFLDTFWDSRDVNKFSEYDA